MNLLQLTIMFIFGYLFGRYRQKISSGKCGFCGGDLYSDMGEVRCERCGAVI
jgi:hypothetical protein